MTSPTSQEREREIFRKGFLLVLVLVISAAFLATIKDFLMALFLAAVFSGLTRPVYRRLCTLFRGRESVASAATILLVLMLVVVPVLSFTGIVVGQALQVSTTIEPWLKEQIEATTQQGDLIAQLPIPDSSREFIIKYQETILEKLGQLASSAGTWMVSALATATRGTVSFLVTLFIMLYAMFFFLKSGRETLERILYYMPLPPDQEDRLVVRFVSVTRATLKGTLVIGAVQGGLAGSAFAVAGINGAAFWGTLMALLSLIPGIGTALVWIPAVIHLIATEQTVAGVALAVWCGAIVGTADNVLRPMLVGRDTKMPDLIILLSTLGGLVLFGAVGILIGPIIAALFLTVWEIYGATFEDYLPSRVEVNEEGAA